MAVLVRMDTDKFADVPDEVMRLKETGIFNIRYTHMTAHTARPGITKTGKIMAPALALAAGVVPFSGEPFSYTYLFRAYHVSVSEYPHALDGHHWRHYMGYSGIVWTPEASREWVTDMERQKKELIGKKPDLGDFLHPEDKQRRMIQIEECIRLEKARQERYDTMAEGEKAELRHPKPEMYVFGRELDDAVARGKLFGKPVQRNDHPFVPAEINLYRYLKGMFTSLDGAETKRWVREVSKREIPVGSLDALATWERMQGIVHR